MADGIDRGEDWANLAEELGVPDAAATAFQPEDYVNYDPYAADPGILARKIRYVVRQESRYRDRVAYSVTRYNPIGQGWHVATYDSYEAAIAVRAVLQAFSDGEVH